MSPLENGHEYVTYLILHPRTKSEQSSTILRWMNKCPETKLRDFTVGLLKCERMGQLRVKTSPSWLRAILDEKKYFCPYLSLEIQTVKIWWKDGFPHQHIRVPLWLVCVALVWNDWWNIFHILTEKATCDLARANSQSTKLPVIAQYCTE